MKTSKNKKIMVLIVAYNAEKTIKSLLERFPKDALSRVDEILLADDAPIGGAPRDNTLAVVNEYKQKHKLKKLTIIQHKENKGYGGNQKFGYDYAMKKGYDIVVMVHGDAQYPPEYILPLVDKMEAEGADFAYGSRMSGDPLGGKMPLYKFFGNIFLTTIENIVLNTNLTEFHSGFRAYRLTALKQIPLHLTSDNFHFDSEIIIQLVIAKKKISEITIPTFYGDEKCNVKVIQYGINILKILGQYLLTKYHLKEYSKFSFKNGISN